MPRDPDPDHQQYFRYDPAATAGAPPRQDEAYRQGEAQAATQRNTAAARAAQVAAQAASDKAWRGDQGPVAYSPTDKEMEVVRNNVQGASASAIPGSYNEMYGHLGPQDAAHKQLNATGGLASRGGQHGTQYQSQLDQATAQYGQPALRAANQYVQKTKLPPQTTLSSLPTNATPYIEPSVEPDRSHMIRTASAYQSGIDSAFHQRGFIKTSGKIEHIKRIIEETLKPTQLKTDAPTQSKYPELPKGEGTNSMGSTPMLGR